MKHKIRNICAVEMHIIQDTIILLNIVFQIKIFQILYMPSLAFCKN